MATDSHRDWPSTVFRLSGLPSTVTTLDDVANLLSDRLGDTPTNCIRVFSLATALHVRDPARFKVATVMFSSAPSLINSLFSSNELLIPARPMDTFGDLILDTHFMGITPLNDHEPSKHTFE